MTNELNKNLDRYTIESNLKCVCGWNSKELAWKENEARTAKHNLEYTYGNWDGKYLKNELKVQTVCEDKLDDYLKAVCRPVDLTRNLDGWLHDGDIIRLKCPLGSNSVFLSALPENVDKGYFASPVRATGTDGSEITVRNAFQVYRADERIPSSVPLMYDECIYICTLFHTGQLMLSSEMKTYEKYSILSGNQEVSWEDYVSGRTLWKVLLGGKRHSKDRPKYRYIPVNMDVFVRHVVTNQNLAIEEDYKISTIMGSEYEVSAQTQACRVKPEVKDLWILEAPYFHSR